MSLLYKIEIHARSEVLKYTEGSTVYYFNATPYKGIWTVSMVNNDEELSEFKVEIVKERLKKFIESKKVFGFFGKKYRSKFVYDPENYSTKR